MPVCYGSIDLPSCSILFLEDIGTDDRSDRTLAWYGRYSRLLGQMNGMAVDPADEPRWLSGDFLTAEVRRASSLVDCLHATPSNSASARVYTPQNRSDSFKILERSDDLLGALGPLPIGFSHLDAFSRNVIQRGDDLVLFDWSLAGKAPIGADLAGLFLITLIHMDVDVDDIAAFETVLLDSLFAGLTDVGNPLAATDLQFAFTAATLLRLVGFMIDARPVLEDDPTVFESITGRPLDEILDAWSKIWNHVRPAITSLDQHTEAKHQTRGPM
jgi:hypothetical protein